MSCKRKFFYVFQGKNAIDEIEGGYLWAGKTNLSGEQFHHWTRMKDVKKGDMIFHSYHQHIRGISIAKTDAYTAGHPHEKYYEMGWTDGWQVDIEYYALQYPINPQMYWEEIKGFQPTKYSPFNKNGTGNQGYFYSLVEEMADYFLNIITQIERAEDMINYEFEKGIHSSLLETDILEYENCPKPRTTPKNVKGCNIYPRDRKISINALALANYECEIDCTHPTFMCRNSDKPYTESHHLIPMSQQSNFENSLDREQNIVSLCSCCHNQIHYGKDADILLAKLYEKRKEDLKAIGIDVTFSKLLEIYGLE